jgi:hypothetical protein
MLRHARTHSNSNAHRCTEAPATCHFSAPRAEMLRVHIERVHSGSATGSSAASASAVSGRGGKSGQAKSKRRTGAQVGLTQSESTGSGDEKSAGEDENDAVASSTSSASSSGAAAAPLRNVRRKTSASAGANANASSSVGIIAHGLSSEAAAAAAAASAAISELFALNGAASSIGQSNAGGGDFGAAMHAAMADSSSRAPHTAAAPAVPLTSQTLVGTPAAAEANLHH